MSQRKPHPNPEVERLIQTAINAGTSEEIVRMQIKDFERTVRENSPSLEQQVREERNLPHPSQTLKPKEHVMGPAELEVRHLLEHEPLPVDPNAPEPQHITIKEFLQKHPSDRWYVQDRRTEGLTDHEIEQKLPYFIRTLNQNVESEVRSDLGLPSLRETRDESEPSELEQQIRRKNSLPKVSRR
jgi:hypothetical protein